MNSDNNEFVSDNPSDAQFNSSHLDQIPSKGRKNSQYNKKTASFIASEVANGLDIAQIAKKYPKKVPKDMVIYQWLQRKPEFRELINEAFEIWLYRKMEELNYVTTTSREILYPDLDARDAYEARRAHVDGLKFVLGKMAPILSKRFTPKSTIEHTGEALGPQIQVINYSIKDIPSHRVIDGTTVSSAGQIVSDNSGDNISLELMVEVEEKEE
jgi:hypothetical protein